MEHFLLIFDLDGTLVDSAADLRAALNQMLRERGRPSLSLPQVKQMIGDGAAALVARALAASGGNPADAAGALPRFIELYEADAVRLSRPYPAVPETLAALRRRGYRTAICTNKPQHATLTVLEGLGLLPLFDAVAGGDRFPVRKPDPGHLSGLIGALGARAEAAAMIGDSENDAAVARGAGLPLVLMRYGYARADPDSLGADAVLDQFADLPAVLDRLGLYP
jgi:phosphoglycolate phosphatase